MKRFAVVVGGLLVLLVGGFFLVMFTLGEHERPGTPTDARLPGGMERSDDPAGRVMLDRDTPAVDDGSTKRILFGDLHAHTTFSFDAFLASLPMLGGQGAHPPADACDFARFVSRLDFWSINDHAEGLTPRHWRETRKAIRECSRAAGPPGEKDLVSFLGWEWSQVGTRPDNHYGHKNVVLKHVRGDSVPSMPIASRSPHSKPLDFPPKSLRTRILSLLMGYDNWKRVQDLAVYKAELDAVPTCPADGACYRIARTPAELFDVLDEDGHEALVIPHGTTWGFYTPPGSDWKKQLTHDHHDPERQRLIEVYSGHGNSEEYRSFRSASFDEDGYSTCPRPTGNFTPCCWRAGELIRERCGDPDSTSCRRRVREARRNYLKAGSIGHRTVPGTEPSDWGDCGVCRDCYNPAFKYRPRSSVQYLMALRRLPDTGAKAIQFNMGFIASSDNHTARPGTGYKEFARRHMTEASGPTSPRADRARNEDRQGTAARSIPPGELDRDFVLRMLERERQATFLMTGGLAAVHAEERSRESIWSAFQRREVYGTSGDRILLWFDLLNGPGAKEHPMGSRAAVHHPPRFRVRAAGAFRQKPGCPDQVREALGEERLQELALGECYNPGDERHAIETIEVVRIQRQKNLEQPVDDLIEDPWKRFDCPADGTGCAVTFSDTTWDPTRGRETLYYVRALQEPTPAVNAGGVRCRERDEDRFCVEPNVCHGDYRTPADEDCLASNRERAWSSPIFVRPPNRSSRGGAP